MTHNRQIFVVLSCGRAGSNLVADLLGTHPEIVNLGETLYTRSYRQFFRFFIPPRIYFHLITHTKVIHRIRNFFRFLKHGVWPSEDEIKLHKSKVWCVKDNFQDIEVKNILPYLSEQTNWKVVVLVRNNIVRKWISTKLAIRDRIWVARSKPSPMPRAKYDWRDRGAEKLVKELIRLEQTQKRMLEFIKNSKLDMKIVTYEDFASSDQTILELGKSLVEWLGMPDAHLTPKTKKILDRPIKDLVEDYENFRLALKGSPFESMLDS